MSIFDHFNKRMPRANSAGQVEALYAKLREELNSNAEEDKQKYDADEEALDAFLGRLQLSLKRHIENIYNVAATDSMEKEKSAELIETPIDAAIQVEVLEGRLCAYACIFPPLAGGKEKKVEVLLEDLHYDGVTYGIDSQILSQMVQRKRYLHMFPIARGTPPIDGKNAQVIDFYKRKNVFRLDVEEGTAIDFSERDLIQGIRKGEIICRLETAVKGKDGMDVTGRVIHCKNGADANLPKGRNTIKSKDGLLLMADSDGAVCMDDGKFCVERQKVIFSDVDASTGDLDYPGEVLIKGNVLEGKIVKCTGNVIIEGEVRGGHVISGGSIRIQHGVRGQHISTIRATRQVQCEIIEEAKVEAGESVFADVIMDSDVTSGGSVYVIGGRGLLVGGQIKTRYSVVAKKIGNQSGCLNLIILGYWPELKKKIEDTEVELDRTKRTLEKIRKNVTTMRAINGSISMERRAILEQLTEQKTLHEEKAKKLEKDLQQLKQAASPGECRVNCEELYPTTAIKIGDKNLTVTTQQKDCNVRIYSGRLILK